jgi:TATA-box binding protein (TBP) (component of TFIID and TFIIIB)
MTDAPLMPTSAPEMAPLKLITMTVNALMDVNLNLDVVARHTTLNDQIVGISYRDIVRGVCTKSKSKARSDGSIKQEDSDDYYTTDSISGKFKNQCTFIVNVGEKNINTKIFNNGKMVSVGCKDREHAVIAANILRETFLEMEGLVIYTIPATIQNNNVKKFFKDDLRKKFGDLVQLLAVELQLEDFNIEPYSEAMPADLAYTKFQEEVANSPSYQIDVMYIYTIITILKCYYPEESLLDNYNTSEFQYLLFVIIENTNHNKGGGGEISSEFPSYLNNKQLIPFDEETVRVSLINQSTNCGYFINRNRLQDLMLHTPGVVRCEYDKNRYPGVITVYRTPTKDVKVILFNTGKINITSTRTEEQVQEAYQFITSICRDYFDDLLLHSEYHNQLKEYEDKLPTQFHVGLVDDQQYYLLKKTSITSNPRNIRFLRLKKLLDMYR